MCEFVFNSKEDEQYNEDLKSFIEQYERESTQFWDRNYLGHMNYDVGKPYHDALVGTIKYNQNIVAKESSPLATKLEKEYVNTILELFGFFNGWGHIASCGTVSNLEAIWIGRNKSKAKGKRPRYVLAPTDKHYSITKACDILGLELKPLAIDENVPPNEIAVIICVCGTTETGRCDDLLYWKKYCEKHDIQLHVDAAYGGYYIYCKDSTYLTESSRLMLQNISCADSITIDPHKMGYVPYCASVFIIKDQKDVEYINSIKEVSYLGVTDSTLYTLEGSRSGACAASLYFGHKHFHEKYHDILESNLIGASLLVKKIEQSEVFKLYPVHDMGLILFTSTKVPMVYLVKMFCNYKNVQNNKIQMVTTAIDGITYFRVCIMDPCFKDYVDEWFEKLLKEYKEYSDSFEVYVQNRLNDILSISEECDTKEELEKLIRSGEDIVAYNGFEPSGRIHIAQAIITVLNVNKLVENGCYVKIYIADWFAQLNHKMGGDLEKIRIVGKYFIEVFKACGISLENVEFIWASDLIKKSPTYWERVLDITTKTTYKRAIRCSQIMGRKEEDNLSVSQLLYPCMQCADIFELGVDVPQLGVDQRKCNMLAREYADKVGMVKPINLAHHMLMGLKGSKAGKMSKSIPDSAIFMEDDEQEVNRKIKAAFCDDNTEGNPMFEYIKYIIIRWFGEIEIEGHVYKSIEEVAEHFKEFDKKTLKETVAMYVNKILQPVREHFEKPGMKELAEQVRGFIVTR